MGEMLERCKWRPKPRAQLTEKASYFSFPAQKVRGKRSERLLQGATAHYLLDWSGTVPWARRAGLDLAWNLLSPTPSS